METEEIRSFVFDTYMIKAKDVREGMFIYIEKKNLWHHVDFIDYDANRLVFISEFGVSKSKGLLSIQFKFKQTDDIIVFGTTDNHEF
jgi:hypothetical protein